MTDKPTLTTSVRPIADNQNSPTAGRGPVLLQDYRLLVLAHQNRERIPSALVHAKGWGAFGTLTVTHDITRYTRARSSPRWASRPICWLLHRGGEPGAADAERMRGFASSSTPKKATGTWSATTPLSSSWRPYKFPDFIHTQKRHRAPTCAPIRP